jgi:hypothetical protein
MSTTSSPPQSDGTNQHSPWTLTQNHQLLSLRDKDNATWSFIAATMGRSIPACQQHYYGLRQAQDGSMVDWTAPLDHYIVEGRRRGLPIASIAQEMSLTTLAVQDRWYALIRQHEVPKDVLAVSRRKEEVVWSEAEDRRVLGLWLEGRNDDEIVKMVRFEGKSEADVRARRKRLVTDRSPLYLEMLGFSKENKEVKNGLQKALGKKKYEWM